MAKWKYEDYANGAMAIVGIALMVNTSYQAYKHEVLEADRRKANRWIDQATARLNCMIEHMHKQRATKECFKEALTASKNVLAFEVREILGTDNASMTDALKEMHARIDKQIANIR